MKNNLIALSLFTHTGSSQSRMLLSGIDAMDCETYCFHQSAYALVLLSAPCCRTR